jgi:molybdate transport system regulatory protein
MKVSARNAFPGRITAIHPGPINAELLVRTEGGDEIVVIVTQDSMKALGLKLGKSVVALVKAPWVMLASGDGTGHFSARNQLRGQVSFIHKGGINTEVGLRLDSGMAVCAVVTNEAVAELQLTPGSAAIAVIKASDVMIGVRD